MFIKLFTPSFFAVLIFTANFSSAMKSPEKIQENELFDPTHIKKTSREDEQDDSSKNTTSEGDQRVDTPTGLSSLPCEMICHIANFLEGEDKEGNNNFANFALVSRNIYTFLLSYKALFIPTDEQEIIKSIQHRAFEDIRSLIPKWSRIKKLFIIEKLEKIALSYSNHNYDPFMKALDYEQKMKDFKMDLKFKFLNLFLSGKEKYYEALVNIKKSKTKDYNKDTSQEEISDEADQLRVVQAALLNKNFLEIIKKSKRSIMASILEELIKRERAFLFVTKFFENIEVPRE